MVAANDFGNVIVRAAGGAFWRICPENLSARVIARTQQEYGAVLRDEEFRLDWEMRRLVDSARSRLGLISAERFYCLKMPAPFGGTYDADNIGMISRLELIECSGDLAQQIKDLPDGTRMELAVAPRPDPDLPRPGHAVHAAGAAVGRVCRALQRYGQRQAVHHCG
jgi:hypothetical protein